MKLYDELIGIVSRLEEEGIDYGLCGGIAVALHGYARFTRDIDLLVQLDDISRIKKCVEKNGFLFSAGSMPFDVGKKTQREIHRVSKIDGEDVLTLDLVVVNEILKDVWIDREIYDLNGTLINIVSIDGVIKMKKISGREQDVVDIQQLEKIIRGGE